MGKPIPTAGEGICFACPDVCKTPAPVPSGFVPIPYPNTGQLADAKPTATKNVLVGSEGIITSKSEIPYLKTTGDEPGSLGGIISGTTKGEVKFVTYSISVKAEGSHVVRMFDSTTQNNGNAVGQVLAGVPNVLVGD